MVLGTPKVVNSSPLDELHNRLNEQARLLSEQQKAIHGIQHSQNQVPKTRSSPFSHQALPYDPSIPPPNLVSTPQRMNELDKYSENYHDDPSHPCEDQDFVYDDKTCMKIEPMPPYQSGSIKNDDNSNLLDDMTCELLLTLQQTTRYRIYA